MASKTKWLASHRHIRIIKASTGQTDRQTDGRTNEHTRNERKRERERESEWGEGSWGRLRKRFPRRETQKHGGRCSSTRDVACSRRDAAGLVGQRPGRPWKHASDWPPASLTSLLSNRRNNKPQTQPPFLSLSFSFPSSAWFSPPPPPLLLLLPPLSPPPPGGRW